jgi:beta-lactam-binding protein with PASTA domain
MRHSATRLVIPLLVVIACTGEPARQGPTDTVTTSPSAPSAVVPDVVGQNFLRAMVKAHPQFRLLDVRYRESSEVTNGTILSQRPAAGTLIDSTKSGTVIRVVVSTSPA